MILSDWFKQNYIDIFFLAAVPLRSEHRMAKPELYLSHVLGHEGEVPRSPLHPRCSEQYPRIMVPRFDRYLSVFLFPCFFLKCKCSYLKAWFPF